MIQTDWISHLSSSSSFTISALILSLASMCVTQMQPMISVRVSELDGSRQVATSEQNYAIESPAFAQQGLRCVSVNGDQVKLVGLDNRVIDTNVAQLTPEQRQLINQVRTQMSQTFMFGPWGSSDVQLQISNQMPGANAQVFSGSSLSSSSSSSSGSNSINSFNFNDNGRSISGTDSNNFSLSRANLPFNWYRIFVNNDMLTTISLDGSVLMRPLIMLSPQEQQQVQEIKNEVELARQQFQRGMQEFQQSMHNFGQNLHQTLQQSFNPFMGQQHQYYPYEDQYQSMPIDGAYAGAYAGPAGPTPPHYSNGYYHEPTHYDNNYNAQPRSMFGNSFPFGPNNSPFGNSFPFGPINSPFGNGFPFNNMRN